MSSPKGRHVSTMFAAVVATLLLSTERSPAQCGGRQMQNGSPQQNNLRAAPGPRQIALRIAGPQQNPTLVALQQQNALLAAALQQQNAVQAGAVPPPQQNALAVQQPRQPRNAPAVQPRAVPLPELGEPVEKPEDPEQVAARQVSMAGRLVDDANAAQLSGEP